jgi:hypothetical protein
VFRYLRVRREPAKVTPDRSQISSQDLERDPRIPLTLRQINNLPENAKRRIYRGLLPAELLIQHGVDPIDWEKGGGSHIRMQAEAETSKVSLGVRKSPAAKDEFIQIELSDNAFNGIDLDLLVLNDPDGERYHVDVDEAGQDNLLGTAGRNLPEEQRAKRDGLAPAQVRPSLGGSRQALDQIEAFLVLMGHRAYFLEPLTYASAWVFERRGFAYVRGHKLMDDIHRQFQPGGDLHQALDDSTPFRQPEQWTTVRGRAWAIHDGILAVIDAQWNGLRMVKQVGRHAGVITFPLADY